MIFVLNLLKLDSVIKIPQPGPNDDKPYIGIDAKLLARSLQVGIKRRLYIRPAPGKKLKRKTIKVNRPPRVQTQ